MLETNKKLILVYGTLRPGEGNNRLLVDSKHIGTVRTKENMVMYSTGRGGGIPFVSKARKISPIVGDIYEVDDAALIRLDALEGYNPNDKTGWYLRREVECINEKGEEIIAEMYYNENTTSNIIYNGNFCNPSFTPDEEEE